MAVTAARAETGARILLLAVALGGCASGRDTGFADVAAPKPGAADFARTGPNTVRGDRVRGYPVYQVEQLLAGRVPGTQVIRGAGGGFSLLIRGTSSLYGSSEPIYVVDGMLVQTVPGRGLDWLNPNDIETIEILKDANSLSWYGVRGANGVVVITTRRGRYRQG
jgi:TonB-dependent SusC/RagA subfamily outer membrane receptor